MGRAVIDALGFRTGYTHMEWYRTFRGEAVFGEIGARSPGAGLVDLINYASDIDTYTGWAEAVVLGRFTQKAERKYNAAWVYKRAQGQGRIQRYDGLEAILSEMGPHIVTIDLNPIGALRRDWGASWLATAWLSSGTRTSPRRVRWPSAWRPTST
jgi:hypothetical protein